jgi:hypothetical protein
MGTKGTTIISNARNHSPMDKVSHTRRPESFSEMLVTMHKTTQDHNFRNPNALFFKGPMTTYTINKSNANISLRQIMPSKNALAATVLIIIPRPMQCPGHLNIRP